MRLDVCVCVCGPFEDGAARARVKAALRVRVHPRALVGGWSRALKNEKSAAAVACERGHRSSQATRRGSHRSSIKCQRILSVPFKHNRRWKCQHLKGLLHFKPLVLFFLSFFLSLLSLLKLSQKCERNRQEYQPISVKNRCISAAEWLSPPFGGALLMAVYHKL